MGRSEGGKVGRSEGGKVGRSDVGKIGRFEGGKPHGSLYLPQFLPYTFLLIPTKYTALSKSDNMYSCTLFLFS